MGRVFGMTVSLLVLVRPGSGQPPAPIIGGGIDLIGTGFCKPAGPVAIGEGKLNLRCVAAACFRRERRDDVSLDVYTASDSAGQGDSELWYPETGGPQTVGLALSPSDHHERLV